MKTHRGNQGPSHSWVCSPQDCSRMWRHLTARIFRTLAAVAVVVGMIAVFPAEAAAPVTNGRIAFTRRDPLGNEMIYTANPDGSDERLLFPVGGEQPRWSPDGSEVDVRTYDFAFSATIVNPWSGSVRNLPVPDPVFTCTPTTTPEECANTDFSCQMAWSPDGSRLACGAISGVDPEPQRYLHGALIGRGWPDAD